MDKMQAEFVGQLKMMIVDAVTSAVDDAPFETFANASDEFWQEFEAQVVAGFQNGVYETRLMMMDYSEGLAITTDGSDKDPMNMRKFRECVDQMLSYEEPLEPDRKKAAIADLEYALAKVRAMQEVT